MIADTTAMVVQGLDRVGNDLESLWDVAFNQVVPDRSWMYRVLFSGFFGLGIQFNVRSCADDLPTLETDVPSVLALLGGWKRPDVMAAVALDLEAAIVLLDAAGALSR